MAVLRYLVGSRSSTELVLIMVLREDGGAVVEWTVFSSQGFAEVTLVRHLAKKGQSTLLRNIQFGADAHEGPLVNVKGFTTGFISTLQKGPRLKPTANSSANEKTPTEKMKIWKPMLRSTLPIKGGDVAPSHGQAKIKAALGRFMRMCLQTLVTSASVVVKLATKHTSMSWVYWLNVA